ncbi:hypothetical protein FKM82_025846 [Ascaphus truei]
MFSMEMGDLDSVPWSSRYRPSGSLVTFVGVKGMLFLISMATPRFLLGDDAKYPWGKVCLNVLWIWGIEVGFLDINYIAFGFF